MIKKQTVKIWNKTLDEEGKDDFLFVCAMEGAVDLEHHVHVILDDEQIKTLAEVAAAVARKDGDGTPNSGLVVPSRKE